MLARAADWYLARDYVAEAVEPRIRCRRRRRGAPELLRSTGAVLPRDGALSGTSSLGRSCPRRACRGTRGCACRWRGPRASAASSSRMGSWLDAAEPLIHDDSPTLDGWRTLRGAAATVRARRSRHRPRRRDTALAAATLAVELESDPDLAGYVVARTVLGAMLSFADRSDEAIPYLDDAWAPRPGARPAAAAGRPGRQHPGLALLETDRLDRLRRLFADVAPAVDAAEKLVGQRRRPRRRPACGPSRADSPTGTATSAPLARVLRRRRRARPHLRRGPGPGHRADRARRGRARPAPRGRCRSAARSPRGHRHRARAPALRTPARQVQQRADRHLDGHSTRHAGVRIEELTDREHAVLTALAGDATQREIAASLYLSINTVKGYTKILYRKLGVGTRQEAVRQARALGLL